MRFFVYLQKIGARSKEHSHKKPLYMIISPPSISIVMPAFNAAPYIGAAIDSVLAQTYPGWELVIVNDGSTDDTLAIADSYSLKDNRIRVFSMNAP